MAMITCPECKKKISEIAGRLSKRWLQTNPRKDIRNQKEGTGKVSGIGCLSVIVIVMIFNIFSSDNTKDTPKTKEQIQEEQTKTKEPIRKAPSHTPAQPVP